MNSINYPIKYAVLELIEPGGSSIGYKNITKGFIVSKCYVIGSEIVYNYNGTSKILHKVVFPYKDLTEFKKLLKNGKQIIGDADFPKYGINNTHEVENLFESYEEAKVAADAKNQELIDIIWPEDYKEDLKIFEDGLKICNLYEQLILKQTEDMIVSKEIVIDKPKSFVKILKPVK